MSALTPSLARYLLEIQRGARRRTDLAARLSVAKPSVTKAIDRLVSLGYVEESHGRALALTGRGSVAAGALSSAADTMARSLTDQGVSPACARRLAEEGALGGCACTDLAGCERF